MASNLKGWIGFAIITVIIIGGAFGTSHILKTSNATTAIQGISASGVNGYYKSGNQTYVANITQSTTTVSFSVSISLVAATGPLNISVVSPSIENFTAYNNTFSALYNKIYNESVNNTLSSGGSLNATVNATLAANATRLASIYTNQNLTYSLFPSVSDDVTYTGGAYTYNLTVTLNSTAVGLMKSGESLPAVINAAAGAHSAIATIQFVKS